MTATTKQGLDRMLVNEYLSWAQQQECGKFQLIDGKVMSMAPERADHARAKRRVADVLDAAFKAKGLSCETFVDGLSVAVDEKTVYEPDVLVTCGYPVPDDSLIAANPVIVVEIVSPYSERRDLKLKLIDYFSHPSIRHYLIVSLDRKTVLHHAKSNGDTVLTRIVKACGILELDPPGITISTRNLLHSSSSS
jgi:Uma2 family endonuclease